MTVGLRSRSIRSEISKRASQLLLHSNFADGITPGVFGPQQRQPRHRAALLPPLELPKFAGGYTNWSDFYSMFTMIIDSHPDLTNVEKLLHLRSCLRDAALETIRSLEISDGNYAIALDLLQSRFVIDVWLFTHTLLRSWDLTRCRVVPSRHFGSCPINSTLIFVLSKDWARRNKSQDA